MDQGLAAVLGALAGAFATAGGAYLTTRSSERLHKRQARRESYLALLRTFEPFFARALEVNRTLVNFHTPQYGLEQLNSQLSEISEKLTELRICAASVVLEGPRSIGDRAREASSHATSYLTACYEIRNSLTGSSSRISDEQKHDLEGWELLLASIFALFQTSASGHV